MPEVKCPRCKGKKKIRKKGTLAWETCGRCGGTGTIWVDAGSGF
jgi:DnaJ-class molecular chaperone